MRFESPEAFLAQALHAFRSYLDTLVLIGGFAVRCYSLHPRAVQTDLRALRTFDVDFALPARLAPIGGQRLVDLADAAGFAQDLRGDFIHPVMKFVPVDADDPNRAGFPSAYSIEFLTPLIGRPDDPEGQPLVTADVQAGLTAQRLRYLDLLLEAPWTVAIGHLPGVPAGEPPLEVQLPHPGCFLVQKLLIADKRDPETERPKDLAYVYQVVQLFARDLPHLAETVRTIMEASPLWRSWLARARWVAGRLFAGPGSTGVTEARKALAAELVGTGATIPSPAQIHAAVRVFLRAL